MNEELSQLIIKNSMVIETSKVLLNEIEKKFYTALEKHTFKYLKGKKTI